MEQITLLIEKESALLGILSLPKIYILSFVIAKKSKFLQLSCVSLWRQTQERIVWSELWHRRWVRGLQQGSASMTQ